MSIAALTDSRLAALCAEETCKALQEYEARFDEITRRARDRLHTNDHMHHVISISIDGLQICMYVLRPCMHHVMRTYVHVVRM